MKMLSRQRPLPSIEIRVPIRFSRSVQAKEVNCAPWTPFCVSRGGCWWSVDLFLSGADYTEDFAGDVALEHPNGFELGMSHGRALGDVGLCPRVEAHPGDGDDVQRAVGRPVTASVQAMPDRLARRCGRRADTAERGEAGLGHEAARIVSGG